VLHLFQCDLKRHSDLGLLQGISILIDGLAQLRPFRSSTSVIDDPFFFFLIGIQINDIFAKRVPSVSGTS
jgi:hypothetical protein